MLLKEVEVQNFQVSMSGNKGEISFNGSTCEKLSHYLLIIPKIYDKNMILHEIPCNLGIGMRKYSVSYWFGNNK